VDLDYFSPDGSSIDPSSIVFTGKMSYHANVAAALDLIERIMPLVWRQRPDARLTVVGQNPPPSLRRAAGDRVTVTGTVGDLRPYLRRAAVAACPMRYGTGIQNKILEAMACGTPVVASTLACTALTAGPGDELLVAESHEALASAIVRLLEDQALRGRIGSRGRAYVTANHDGEVLIKRLEGLYAGLV
jgi:glycosyltransferase involved in cell wall biosynthesis